MPRVTLVGKKNFTSMPWLQVAPTLLLVGRGTEGWVGERETHTMEEVPAMKRSGGRGPDKSYRVYSALNRDENDPSDT